MGVASAVETLDLQRNAQAISGEFSTGAVENDCKNPEVRGGEIDAGGLQDGLSTT